MNLNDWLQNSTKKLELAGIPTARLDCLVLLQDILNKDKSYILAHTELELEADIIKTLDAHIERRVSHEPLAYIRGKSEFYGREFLVTADTLEPRPETETIIDLLKSCQDLTDERVRPLGILDVGTGSGCLAITAKLEFPECNVYATDISDACLIVAKKNAEKLNADVQFFKGNLLEALQSTIYHQPFTILANLPYVPDEHTINQAAMHEPSMAIFGGPDGLDLYRQMFTQINNLANKPQLILTESLPFQHKELAQIADEASYSLKTSEDFIQVLEPTP